MANKNKNTGPPKDPVRDELMREKWSGDMANVWVQTNLSKVEVKHSDYINQNDKWDDKIKELKKKMKATMRKLEEEHEGQSETLRDLEMEAVQLRQNIKEIKEKFKIDQGKIDDEWTTILQDIETKIKTEETKWEQSAVNQALKKDIEEKRIALQEQLEEERKILMREKADMEREKVKETNKLRNDMDKKIDETQNSLFALKQVQLQTTTRQTVLQNHQLTNELEYQSKQTEKLLSKNQKLQEMVVSLKRDVEIHKQVETELAQRSQSSQGMINKLSDKVRFLEEEKDDLLDNLNGAQDRYNDINYEEIDQKLMHLEKDLNNGTKSANQIQKDCEKLADENQELKDRLNKLHEGEPTVLTILQDNYEKICSGQPDPQDLPSLQSCQIDTNPKDLSADILNSLSSEERDALCEFLIDKVQPYLLNTIFYDVPEEDEDKDNMRETHKISTEGFLPKQDTKQNRNGAVQSIAYQKTDFFKDIENKFSKLPLEIKTKIVRSNVQDLGKNFKSHSAGVLPKRGISKNRKFYVR